MGALSGIRILEFAGIGPAPFCGMMLADHGAEVIRIDRPGAPLAAQDPLLRSRRSLALDLKRAEAIALVRDLARTADGLIEGFRPGVMERLGLGPETLLADNPGLVYGRMTGWGQSGPLAPRAGHDIDYIAIAGTLHTVGRAGEKPVPPVNYLGDFGGGGMLLAFGMVAALLAVRMGGPGQVIDAAMVDGAALLTAMTRGLHEAGMWRDEPGVNLLDGGAHFYETYVCADGKFLVVGAIEPQFYAVLLAKLDLAADPEFSAQYDAASWPKLKARLAAIFATRPRDHWVAQFEGTDSCVAPVLSLAEAPAHPHNVARQTFVQVGAALQPGPAPRFLATQAASPAPPAPADSDALLVGLGYDAAKAAALRQAKVLG